MKFGNIQALYLLWLLPALFFFYIWTYKKRRRDMERYAQRELLRKLAPASDDGMLRLRYFLVLSALFLLILSLGRPLWGRKMKGAKRGGTDIMIAVDTSKSMLARDLHPDRLQRSKEAVRDLITKLQGERIGLIAFSGKAFLVCPLTYDYDAFDIFLKNLDVRTVPQGGTSLSDAIRVALGSYGDDKKREKVLIIISDGEDHGGKALEWMAKARIQGVRIFTIGTGTTEGDLIPLEDETGNRFFLKDESGNIVTTRLNEYLLRRIASTTGGRYVRATDSDSGLDTLYNEDISTPEKAHRDRGYGNEEFQIPLSIALLLLCIELFLERNRKDLLN